MGHIKLVAFLQFSISNKLQLCSTTLNNFDNGKLN